MFLENRKLRNHVYSKFWIPGRRGTLNIKVVVVYILCPKSSGHGLKDLVRMPISLTSCCDFLPRRCPFSSSPSPTFPPLTPTPQTPDLAPPKFRPCLFELANNGQIIFGFRKSRKCWRDVRSRLIQHWPQGAFQYSKYCQNCGGNGEHVVEFVLLILKHSAHPKTCLPDRYVQNQNVTSLEALHFHY